MPIPKRQTPRPYLTSPERRRQLLDVAGRLVREGGWSSLSMQGLAIAAGVSRQLVYEHFASADDLYLATLGHLFERVPQAEKKQEDKNPGRPVSTAVAPELEKTAFGDGRQCHQRPPKSMRGSTSI